jgi:DNA-binding CsgD family transcriptional regulator
MALARTGAEPPSEGHENRVISAVTAERLQPQLARALTRLSRGERDVILLVALSELSREEVSEALGISYGTVGSRLSRASGHEKILVCGQLAPGARSSVFQSCGHLRSRLLASSLAGLRRVVMHGVPPVWMGLRWFALPISFRRDL